MLLLYPIKLILPVSPNVYSGYRFLLGPGPWNAPIEFRTPSTFLPPPQKVEGMATSDSSIELWWDPPSNTNDAIGYRVKYSEF